MTTRYCDTAMQYQGIRKAWSSGTASATNPGEVYYYTFASAYAAAEDGDTIKVAAGTYELPAAIAKSVLITGFGTTTFEFDPPAPSVTPLDQYMQIAADKVVRFKGGNLTANLGVFGALALDGMASAATGKVFDTGGVVAIGATRHAFTTDQRGSFERYESYFDEGRWPTQFPVSHYRNKAVLEAPTKSRGESGEQVKRWVPVAEFRYLVKDGIGGEATQASVAVASQGSTFFTKPGLPAHQDMRVASRGRYFQITAVSRPSGPGQDLKLTVTEGTGMPWAGSTSA